MRLAGTVSILRKWWHIFPWLAGTDFDFIVWTFKNVNYETDVFFTGCSFNRHTAAGSDE
jgi:hypothetical protein